MNQLGEITPQEQMIRQQIIERGIRDDRVIAAMRSVPRDAFFLPDTRKTAFADRAASIGHGQTISQPYMVALMTSRLQVQDTHKVLEIGTGSGYHTSILARLAREVYTIERLKPLLDSAFEKIMALDLRNIHFRFGDGTAGWLEAAPFDRILIAAGAPDIPRKLLSAQLADGGIAILPVGDDAQQMLVEIRRQGDQLIPSDICPCKFVKLIGQEGWTESAD
ncbi:MAG: protein-L-isoaspartate(D-aspartate) O-methyltransferase [Planctomycetota bacterium]|nr:protein-L-isoaspartate(D-aspartate) O-methyltransferase [Planctomycetota bacterium]